MAVDVVAINGALCEALGVDPAHVKAITVRLVATHLPTVEIEYGQRFLADHPELNDALARFKLVPADEPAEAPA